MRFFTKAVAAALSASLILSVPIAASAEGGASPPGEEMASAYSRNIDAYAAKNEYSLMRVSTKSVSSHSAVTLYYNSKMQSVSGRRINGVVYIPIRNFVDTAGVAQVSYNSVERRISVSGGGHNVSVADGAYALYAAGRVIFSQTPSVILSDGRMYVPAESIARAFSLSFSDDGASARFIGTARAVLSADKYYAEDAVYWLSRIISAESRGESLVGQIAVGNVILNRTRSADFPSTIWGVIFDRRYGVQFSPVANGTIYNTPTSTSILAAKICLEGFCVSDDALYFMAPSAASSSWIERNREYAFTIGGHDFYN